MKIIYYHAWLQLKKINCHTVSIWQRKGRGKSLNSDNIALISGIISGLGTLIGTLGGILVSSKLTAYRLEQLEKKVDKHNSFAERMPVIEEQIKVINHRINDLESHEIH